MHRESEHRDRACVCVRAIESEFSDGVENHNCFLSSCVCVTESCVGESDNNDHLMIVSAGADFQH